ncbi:hypothetical protein AAMO2058_001562400 [Amorphochlora amoebiformis]|uniref:Methyltransferase domain-containing protein n=1 Tax=Amorphochlora amoebiformis TaxID=1561963 RepID=A0A7S0D3E5_9EUKA|mmetsp:Transcript_18466/g.29445  ORF Transcript_18466/g.29445 Transcript_18466/m.29445 type:complete len:380 (+) Transcript_18466:79-1218(+)
MIRSAVLVAFASLALLYLKNNPPVFVIAQGIHMFENGQLPDFLARMGIRSMLQQRLDENTYHNVTHKQDAQLKFIQELRSSPIAIQVEKANEQHYEVDARFYDRVLGPGLKYSSALYDLDTTSVSMASEKLGEAEIRMFKVYHERASLGGNMRVLELGCGWGSLIIFNAASFPSSTFVGVSYSNSQREFIMAKAKKLGLSNVEILTSDMNSFALPEGYEPFDRVISIEMFEHMKNYGKLLAKVSSFLKPKGKLFVHTFNHKDISYHFEPRGPDDWMSRYFFTGGTMASAQTLLYFQRDLKLDKHWLVNGKHYQLTSEAWLQNMDTHKEEVLALFEEYYGVVNADLWFWRWRAFFMACAELFAWADGNEWIVAHYLFEKP